MLAVQDFAVGPGEMPLDPGLSATIDETLGAASGALTGHLVASILISGRLHVADESLGKSVVADSDRAAKGVGRLLGRAGLDAVSTGTLVDRGAGGASQGTATPSVAA